MLKVKDGYKLGLQTPETMKIFGITKKLIDKIKNGENVLSLDVVEVVYMKYNLEDSNIKKSLRYYVHLSINNKPYGYMLHVEPNSSVL